MGSEYLFLIVGSIQTGLNVDLLVGEIDRCLKKVTEGVETFDDIWTKVCSM